MNEVFNRTPEVAPALEVHCELRRDARRLRAVMPRQLFSGLPVELNAPLADQVAVENILVERVCEAIAHREGTIGQLLFLIVSIKW